MTPLKVKQSITANVPSSSTTVKGLVELATTAEAQAGSLTTHAVTPAGAKAAAIAWAPVKTVNGVSPDAAGDVPLGLDDPGWQTVTVFQNSALSFDAPNSVRYRRKNGVVYLDGKIKGATVQNGTGAGVALFTLPTGYRPARKTSFAVIKADTTTTFSIGRIDIDTAGVVYGVLYSPVWNNLADISFLLG